MSSARNMYMSKHMVVAASQKSIEGNVFKACRRDKAGFACKGSDDGLSVIASFALVLQVLV